MGAATTPSVNIAIDTRIAVSIFLILLSKQPIFPLAISFPIIKATSSLE